MSLLFIIGRSGSLVYGSIVDGIFRGVIEDPEYGRFFVEENTVFFGSYLNQSNDNFSHKGHSVIYHEDDVEVPRNRYNCLCFSNDHYQIVKPSFL